MKEERKAKAKGETKSPPEWSVAVHSFVLAVLQPLCRKNRKSSWSFPSFFNLMLPQLLPREIRWDRMKQQSGKLQRG